MFNIHTHIYIFVNLILIMIFGYMISLRYVAIIFAVDHMSQLGMCPSVSGWSCWNLREPNIFVRALSDAEIAWRGMVAIVVHLCYSAFICHAKDGSESFRGIISAQFDLSILSHQLCTPQPCRPRRIRKTWASSLQPWRQNALSSCGPDASSFPSPFASSWGSWGWQVMHWFPVLEPKYV